MEEYEQLVDEQLVYCGECAADQVGQNLKAGYFVAEVPGTEATRFAVYERRTEDEEEG